jgi:hypothetical protein
MFNPSPTSLKKKKGENNFPSTKRDYFFGSGTGT